MATKKVLIICNDDDFVESYIAAGSAIFGGGNVLHAKTPDCAIQHQEWRCGDALEHVVVTVIDGLALTPAASIRSYPTLAGIVGCSGRVVVLNAEGRRKAAEEIRKMASDVRIEPTHVKGNTLATMLADLAPIVALPRDGEISRALPPSGVSRVSHLDSEDSASEVLSSLVEQLIEDKDILETRYVTKTSQIILEETVDRKLPPALDIESAIQELCVFLKTARGTGNGKLVVGEKGAGKTTLTHYAALSAADEVPNLVFLPINYQWIPVYDVDNRFDRLTDALIAILPNTGTHTSESFFDDLRSRVKQDKWDDLAQPSLGSQNLLSTLTQDEGFLLGLFCHFSKTNDMLTRYIDRYDRFRQEFIDEAEEWLKELSLKPEKLLAYVLLFAVEMQRSEFEDFSFHRIMASLLAEAKRKPVVKSVVCRFLPNNMRRTLGKGELDVYAIEEHYGTHSRGTLAGFLCRCIGMRSRKPGLLSLVRDCLRELSKIGCNIVFFVDNIDAKFSERVELLLLRYSVSFLTRLKELVSSDFIVCVRNSTFSSHPFTRLDAQKLLMWTSLQVRPPDLGALLKKRLDCMRASCDWIGRSDWFLTDFLYRWVSGMVGGRWPRTFLDIIEKRHPQDVRGQLDLFCTAARSTVLHERRLRKLRQHKVTSWGQVKPEFCLRALVWGKEEYYREADQQFVPNVFNNLSPQSPFNALIRVMIIEWCHLMSRFRMEELFTTFENAGVPRPEIDKALLVFESFSLVRSAYSDGGDELYITVWGKYFYENVLFCLAYLQSVWWDVPMLAGFDMGTARLLRWEELQRPAAAFEAWLRVEEGLVKRELRKKNMDFGSLRLSSVWERVATEIAFALNNIERVTPLWVSKD